MGSAGSLTPRLDWNYVAKQQTSAINNNVLAVLPVLFDVLNARLTWKSEEEDWQVAFAVTNVTDKLYYTGIGPNNNSGTTSANPAMPREWSISVKKTF